MTCRRSTISSSRPIRWWVAALAALIAAAGAAIVAHAGSGSSYTPYVDFQQLRGLQQTAPSAWASNNGDATLSARLPALHLDALRQEALAFHIHQHLDLYVNGTHIQVPAGIGFLPNAVTELHTHATDGVIHVESGTQRNYSLGQLFGEWGIRLDTNHIGTVRGNMFWWINGSAQHGNPARALLRNHQVIVLALGKKPPAIRKSFNWAASTAGG
jgi:hypothetical protein